MIAEKRHIWPGHYDAAGRWDDWPRRHQEDPHLPDMVECQEFVLKLRPLPPHWQKAGRDDHAVDWLRDLKSRRGQGQFLFQPGGFASPSPEPAPCSQRREPAACSQSREPAACSQSREPAANSQHPPPAPWNRRPADPGLAAPEKWPLPSPVVPVKARPGKSPCQRRDAAMPAKACPAKACPSQPAVASQDASGEAARSQPVVEVQQPVVEAARSQPCSQPQTKRLPARCWRRP